MKTQQVIDFFGGRKEAAEALGIDRTALYQWGDDVPDCRQYQVQVVTKNALVADAEKQKAA